MTVYWRDRFPEGSLESQAGRCTQPSPPHDERWCHECEARADGIEAYLELLRERGTCPICGEGPAPSEIDGKFAVAVEALREITSGGRNEYEMRTLAREALKEMGVKP